MRAHQFGTGLMFRADVTGESVNSSLRKLKGRKAWHLAALKYLSRTTNIPDRTRTCNLRLRRPTLYPIELRGLS